MKSRKLVLVTLSLAMTATVAGYLGSKSTINLKQVALQSYLAAQSPKSNVIAKSEAKNLAGSTDSSTPP